MKIRIYQIDHKKDTERVLFLGTEQLQKLRGSAAINGLIYEETFHGDVDAANLEDVFRIFNLEHPDGYTGRSLSVSDVVEIMNDPERAGFYFCDTVGFKKVEFVLGEETSITMYSPEWGLYPKDLKPRIYWGARAIITDGVVDLLPDRQSFNAAADVSKDEKDEFVAWLDKQAIPYLNQRVQSHDTSHIEFSSRDNHYFCVAEDRNSGGYLYIGAYMRQ